MFSRDEARRTMTRSLLYGPLGFGVTLCLVLGGVAMCRGGGDAPRSSSASEVDGGSMCGDPDARASATRIPDWSRWSCRSERDTDAWERCLPRSEYSDAAGRGCPGDERCCPPAGSP